MRSKGIANLIITYTAAALLAAGGWPALAVEMILRPLETILRVPHSLWPGVGRKGWERPATPSQICGNFPPNPF